MEMVLGKRVYLNDGWFFAERFEPEMTSVQYDDRDMEEVRLPHACTETPFHYFDERQCQMLCCYRRRLAVSKEQEGKYIVLVIEGAAHDCQVFVNGVPAGTHHCGYTAFKVDISHLIRYGEENVLAFRVDSRETLDIPPFGYVVDYMTYGGIYRDVYLEIKNPVCLEDVFVHTHLGQEKPRLCCDITIKSGEDGIGIRQQLRKRGEGAFEDLDIEAAVLGKGRAATACSLEEVKLWDLEHPVLYELKTQLLREGEPVDERVTVFGFRRVEFKKDGFYLNGRRQRLRGLNRHQSYPYVGYAMPASMQRLDADILKWELGMNAVRTSHYPQSHYFVDRCDEIGLLVFMEIPGWQHIGGERWKDQAVENVKDMVTQYRNHPSIMLWGVRINESADDDAFYQRTNDMARSLDPYRQTGGVRAHKKSSLLEDVYTYNDFSHDGAAKGCEPKKNVTPDMEKPYLISEYNGHMYPSKAFDWEGHRTEHAIRHANVLDAVAGEEDIAGGFGWCMADYNTHKDFGSGDRICYHGVMDMFRNPKLAADIYAMQQEERTVLSVSSSMDIGEHPGCNRGKTWIFTNADSVKMYKNDRFIKEYVRGDSPYKNLAHGPIEIDDYIGNAIAENEDFTKKQAEDVKDILNYVARNGLSRFPLRILFKALKLIAVYGMKPSQAVELYNRYVGDWGGASTAYRFEAIKDGRTVKTVVKEPVTQIHLWADADHTLLREEHTYDVAAVRIRMLDQNENQLCFYNEPLQLTVEGPIALIGEPVISLKGGMGGTYVKTTGKSGEAALVIQSAQAGSIRLAFCAAAADGEQL